MKPDKKHSNTLKPDIVSDTDIRKSDPFHSIDFAVTSLGLEGVSVSETALSRARKFLARRK